MSNGCGLTNKDWEQELEDENLTEEESIERAIVQMDILCRSRCVQSPTRANVTVREIDPKE